MITGVYSIKALFPEIQSYRINVFFAFHANDPKSRPILSPAPEITKDRVALWKSETQLPVEISEMPTPLGKAIEALRSEEIKGRFKYSV